jgi:lysine decarboxylase
MTATLPAPPDIRPAPCLDAPSPDHSVAPLFDALRRYVDAGTTAFHVPGHKLGHGGSAALHDMAGAALRHDAWLDTASYAAARQHAETLAAQAWGARRAYLLGNGSTAGNQAFLLSQLSAGQTVVVSRDLHVSTLSALVMTGARPVYVAPRVHPQHHVGLGVHPDDLDAALRKHPDARLVSVVSPGYHGVVADTAALVRTAQSHAAHVFVDEAWGAHLPFHAGLPQHAMAAGAVGAVTSVHKTLPALSSGSLLLAGPDVDAERLDVAVRMTQTTSPLLPLLASVDLARRDLACRGTALVEAAWELAETARDHLRSLDGLVVLDEAALGLPPGRLDPLKIVVDVTGLGLTGLQAEQVLRHELALAPEGSDLRSVFLAAGLGDDPGTIARLCSAFDGLARRHRRPGGIQGGTPLPHSTGEVLAPSHAPLTPQQAWQASSIPLPLAASVDEVCAELVVPYPPGIPVLAPGEVVTAAKVAYLADAVAAGVHIHGAADSQLATLRVVARP